MDGFFRTIGVLIAFSYGLANNVLICSIFIMFEIFLTQSVKYFYHYREKKIKKKH